jgi:hypothetical protein
MQISDVVGRLGETALDPQAPVGSGLPGLVPDLLAEPARGFAYFKTT